MKVIKRLPLLAFDEFDSDFAVEGKFLVLSALSTELTKLFY